MALHPHVPHELKDFSKHLFATFLGLLMALGLEQWREHHHEQKVAEQAREAVKAELIMNRDRLAKGLKDAEGTCAYLKAREALVLELLESRRQRRDPRLPDMPQGGIGGELNFVWHAWDSAKVVGLLRHLTPEERERLSGVYGTMQRAQGLQDAWLPQVRSVCGDAWKEAPLLQALSTDQLYGQLNDIRTFMLHKDFIARLHRRFPKELDAALKGL